MDYRLRHDRMKIIDVVIYIYVLSITICSIVHFCNVQSKSLTSVISLIKYWKTVRSKNGSSTPFG
ncbi:hypothetical protein MtrunA17_Chr8g0369421 [Medicago truncatula]|uniref:Transmembrane protein n=1 Tax=Medicago truncatula TaxID=3880 RepID=A0A396GSK1_MEDTR|nr:hypothetical protein MtrunA17_Chr8g0369421 [Medicago truncatula]